MRFVKRSSACLSGLPGVLAPDVKAMKRAAEEDRVHGAFPRAGPKGGWVFRFGETPFAGIKAHLTERDGGEGDLAHISPNRGSLAPLPTGGLHFDPAASTCTVPTHRAQAGWRVGDLIPQSRLVSLAFLFRRWEAPIPLTLLQSALHYQQGACHFTPLPSCPALAPKPQPHPEG